MSSSELIRAASYAKKKQHAAPQFTPTPDTEPATVSTELFFVRFLFAVEYICAKAARGAGEQLQVPTSSGSSGVVVRGFGRQKRLGATQLRR